MSIDEFWSKDTDFERVQPPHPYFIQSNSIDTECIVENGTLAKLR